VGDSAAGPQRKEPGIAAEACRTSHCPSKDVLQWVGEYPIFTIRQFGDELILQAASRAARKRARDHGGVCARRQDLFLLGR